MVLSLNGILEREFYLLGIARKVFPSDQKTIMINSPEMNFKMIKQLKRDGKRRGRYIILCIYFTCDGKINVSPGHFAKSSRLSFAQTQALNAI